MPLGIRPSVRDDVLEIRRLAVLTGLLTSDEALQLATAAWLTHGAGSPWFSADDDDRPVVGAAYCVREPFSDRVWNLYFIAVHPDAQGRGVGSHLLTAVEEHLRDSHHERATAVVIETSGLDRFATVRDFYRTRGYAQVGEVPDYYAQGDAKVVFWKPLPLAGDRAASV